MGGLVGFILGYYLGAKDGPERLTELRKAFESIAESADFQALRVSLTLMIQQSLGQLQSQVGPAKGTQEISPIDAWKAISESPEFRELIANGTSLFQGMIANFMPQQGRGNGHAEH